ncbi:Asp23/Gls24 family envelope stress response protein [Listeria sp. PSOL-1]|uniref:Asp23/Gls24 family envelope stress response protein n=1 Tax=Listeria sp. PSOL-1 TaxID=1844999 RepID=UPI0013D2716A|nr:Asp23/Gls24 family envelope stress response protein [Listeria sp. PSOL-1]
MAYTNNLRNKEVTLGKIEVAPEVIGVIAGLATCEVDNVAAMQGGFASEVRERLGGTTNYRKGVKIVLEENGITIDVYCTVFFGAIIPLVAESIQTAVRDTILSMTGLSVLEVNVHIVGVQFDKAENVSLEDFPL